MDTQINFCHVDAFPLPIQQQRNVVQLNCLFTITEAILVIFIQKMMRTALNENHPMIYIGISEPMQRAFNEYVAKSFSTDSFNGEQLRLAPLVASVWEKTKVAVENELRMQYDTVGFQDESNWHLITTTQAENLQAIGHIGGKHFTKRQAKFILKL